MAEFIPLAIMAVSTLFQANAQRQSAQANQAIAEREASFQRQKTEFELQQQEETAGKRLATQRAMLSKSRGGVSGSGLDLLSEQARQDELDRILIRFGGDVSASRFDTEAAMEKKKSVTQPIGTLLSGAAKASSMI